MQAVNRGRGARATRRAGKIGPSRPGRLQAGLPPSRSCTVTPGQAATPTLVAVKTVIRRDKNVVPGVTGVVYPGHPAFTPAGATATPMAPPRSIALCRKPDARA